MRLPAPLFAPLAAVLALFGSGLTAPPARAYANEAQQATPPPGYATLPPGATPSPQAAPSSPAPAETPSPGASATPGQSSPAPSPTPQPSGSLGPQRPLRFEHARAGIVTGTTVTIGVSGGSGPLVLQSSFDGVAAEYDAHAHRVVLIGRSPGSGTVTISDSFGDEASLAVLVGPAAGVVPSDVTVELGGTVSPQFALAKIQAAIASAAQLQPGVALSVHGLTLAQTLHPGDLFESDALVLIPGNDTLVEATGTTMVHLHVDTLDQLVPLEVFYSDDPEKLNEDDDGVLYRGTIDTALPARVYLYHVSETPNRRIYLALQTTGQSARVQILGYGAGPSEAYGYVGQVSTLQYLLAHGSQESAIYPVTDGAPVILPVGYRALAPLDLVDGIYDLRVLDGEPVNVEVIAASNGADPLDMLGEPERPGDGHGRRGEYSLSGVAPLALSLAAGAPDPAPMIIGVPGLPNLRPGGRPLAGDYGVLRAVSLTLANPTSDPQTIYLYELPQGGPATTTIWFDGDPRPSQIACVKVPNRYTVRAFPLAPNQSLNVTGSYMTDGASSFPLLFGLTSTPPSPPPGPYSPDACAPRPLPSPTETPTEPASPATAPSPAAAPASPLPSVTASPAATASPSPSPA